MISADCAEEVIILTSNRPIAAPEILLNFTLPLARTIRTDTTSAPQLLLRKIILAMLRLCHSFASGARRFTFFPFDGLKVQNED